MKQTCYIIGIFCCYIIGCYIIGKFPSYIIGADFVTLSGDFVTISVSCYIIGKFGVTLSVDVTLLGVVTLSGVTGHTHYPCSSLVCVICTAPDLPPPYIVQCCMYYHFFVYGAVFFTHTCSPTAIVGSLWPVCSLILRQVFFLFPLHVCIFHHSLSRICLSHCILVVFDFVLTVHNQRSYKVLKVHHV